MSSNPEQPAAPQGQQVEARRRPLAVRLERATQYANGVRANLKTALLGLRGRGVPIEPELHEFEQQEQALASLTAQTVEHVAAIETDEPEIRLQRIVNQRSLEEDVERFQGLPFGERLLQIRRGLFRGIPNVRGEVIDQFRKGEIAPSNSPFMKNAYVNSGRVEQFMEGFSTTIDSLYREISTTPEAQRAEAAVRLASVIYSLGIPIHPFVDGNGQTIKMTMLSYLQEIAPEEFRARFFPYRASNRDADGRTSAEGALKTLVGPPAVQHDVMAGNLPANEERSSLIRFAIDSDNVRYHQERLNKLNALGRPHAWQKKERAKHDRAVAYETEALEYAQHELEERFPDPTTRASLQQQVEFYEREEEQLKGKYPRQTNLHGYLAYMFSDRGREFLGRYVRGEISQTVDEIRGDKSLLGYQKAALPVFIGIGNDIRGILETTEEHQQAYTRITSA